MFITYMKLIIIMNIFMVILYKAGGVEPGHSFYRSDRL